MKIGEKRLGLRLGLGRLGPRTGSGDRGAKGVGEGAGGGGAKEEEGSLRIRPWLSQRAESISVIFFCMVCEYQSPTI